MTDDIIEALRRAADLMDEYGESVVLSRADAQTLRDMAEVLLYSTPLQTEIKRRLAALRKGEK